MAGTVSDDCSVGGSLDGLSSEQQCQSSDVLAEWRSSEQVENGTPSTSPPYWDTDDSDDDGGPKPSELYGKHTWKIEKFSQINKRELRSNAFEVGGYKWYILVYPQGCDVCNHLSLFLCVANHDKLLPGWSHFAQFTIAVVNKDPKKSKFSDTLHRFWKKEHDWGWKKFMELSKVSDGFVDGDALTIKAQVQVIREKVDRPFRCLDCQYRRELVRVYLTNVEQICRRFVEERRGKLGKLIEDKARWSSFGAFWSGMDQSARRRMSKEKKGMILKVVVKHFFIEKEVTSTLVMDSLYSGLKALEGQSKGKKGKGKLLEGEDTPAPIVRVEKDMFVLVDDVLLLLERAAMESLPPKDEKGPQNRTKDGGSGEDFNKDSIERDERRLTELGRRTVEIFVLAHIFSNKIEAAYQEAVSLKRQEELIREEEAAWQAESEQKAKRGAEKDKKSKKKQGKQKRNNRKGKEKTKDDKSLVAGLNKQMRENLTAEGMDLVDPQTMSEKHDRLEDPSDVSDSVECTVDVLHPDSEDRDTSPVNWDTDTSEVQPPEEASGSGISTISTFQNGVDKRSSSLMDDSSSTCSTDSAPSVTMNGSYRMNSSANYNKSHKSPTKGGDQQPKASEGYNGANEASSRPSEAPDATFRNKAFTRRKTVYLNGSEGVITSLQDRTKWPELNAAKKEDEVVLLQRKPSNKDRAEPTINLRSTRSPPNRVSPSPGQAMSDSKNTANAAMVPAKKVLSNGKQLIDKTTTLANASLPAIASRLDSNKAFVPKLDEKVMEQQAAGLSRPSSAPLIPATLPRATTPVVSVVQQVAASSSPSLSRSVSATGRLGPDPSPGAQPFIPQSYRNAIIGNSLSVSSAGFTHSPLPASAALNTSMAFSGSVPISALLGGGQPWMKSPQISSMFESPSMINDNPSSFDLYRPMNSVAREFFPHELLPGPSGRQVQGTMADEFPHLDIINDLLDDEQSIGMGTYRNPIFQGLGNGLTHFNPHFTYPADMTSLQNEASSCRFDRSRSGYHEDGSQQDYSSGSQYDSVREFTPSQGNSMAYMNGQIDSVVPNQWQQLLNPDLSLLGMRSSAMEGYPYNVSDYTNMACGINGYAMFRPSNGH